MLLSRRITLCLLVAAAAPLLHAASPHGEEMEYISGTVEAIPNRTWGVLDLTGESDLIFQYGEPSWNVPFHCIRSFAVEEPAPKRDRSPFARLRSLALPMFSPSPRLTIEFDSEDGRQGKMVLEIRKKSAGALLARLEEKTGRRSGAPEAGSAAEARETKTQPQAWWGDRYWRTNRNADSWPRQQAK